MAQQKEERLSLKKLSERIDTLEEKLEALTPKKTQSINRVETFNGEKEFVPVETSRLQMRDDDKIISMKNAIHILPPNLKVDGRHTKGNIQAICGFLVDDEMVDKAYEG